VPAPGPETVFPIEHLRTGNGRPARPAHRETLYAFFHTDCPTSELALPYLERLRNMDGGAGLRVVAVSQDAPQEAAALSRRLAVAIETLFDPPPWRASQALGLSSVPALARVAPDGRVEELVVGFQREKLEAFAARSAALSGRPAASLFPPGENVPAIRPG
jgi:hypothetical protein